MKAKIWVTLQVEVEVEGDTEQACREAAVAAIPNFEPDQHYVATNRAMEIGAAYPHDVTEIVELVE